jgi:hypothetical protein
MSAQSRHGAATYGRGDEGGDGGRLLRATGERVDGENLWHGERRTRHDTQHDTTRHDTTSDISATRSFLLKKKKKRAE